MCCCRICSEWQGRVQRRLICHGRVVSCYLFGGDDDGDDCGGDDDDEREAHIAAGQKRNKKKCYTMLQSVAKCSRL